MTLAVALSPVEADDDTKEFTDFRYALSTLFVLAFYITNSYFTALHGYASVSLAAVAGGTPAYP